MAEPTPIANAFEKKEPLIHVIPDEFYGAAARAKLPPPPASPAPAGKPTPVPANAAPGGPAPEASAKGGSKAWILIPIIALLVLGGMGFGVWYFILRKPAATEPPKPAVTLPPVTTPEPTPTPEPATNTEPTPPVTEPATSTPVVPPPAPVDADNDGLTDVEETLYGTDAAKADSDADGFSDSVELINLYNPAGFKPNTALEAGLVATFDSKDGGFQIFYPTPWTPTDKGGGDATFANAQQQPITVTVAANAENKSLLDWYLNANPTVSPSEAQQFFTKSGAEGVHGPDTQVSYVAGKGKIYIITLASSGTDTAYFRTTFKMMVNSFKVKP